MAPPRGFTQPIAQRAQNRPGVVLPCVCSLFNSVQQHVTNIPQHHVLVVLIGKILFVQFRSCVQISSAALPGMMHQVSSNKS